MKRRIFLLLLVIFAVACHEEETLTPTETPEFGYSVPQGNHDYDDKIVDWKERFNTFTLYKFELKELYWEVVKWIEETPIENGVRINLQVVLKLQLLTRSMWENNWN